jgi:hypothetical protein
VRTLNKKQKLTLTAAFVLIGISLFLPRHVDNVVRAFACVVGGITLVALSDRSSGATDTQTKS